MLLHFNVIITWTLFIDCFFALNGLFKIFYVCYFQTFPAGGVGAAGAQAGGGAAPGGKPAGEGGVGAAPVGDAGAAERARPGGDGTLLQPGSDGVAGARLGGVDTVNSPGGGAAAPVGNDKSMVPNKDPYSGKVHVSSLWKLI